MSVKKHIAPLRVMSCGNALLWGTDFTLRRWRRRRRNWSLDLGSEENNFRFHRDWWHQAAASRWFDVWCVEAKSISFQWTFQTVLRTLQFLDTTRILIVWCLVLWQRSSRSRFKIHDFLFASFAKRRFLFSFHFTSLHFKLFTSYISNLLNIKRSYCLTYRGICGIWAQWPHWKSVGRGNWRIQQLQCLGTYFSILVEISFKSLRTIKNPVS